MILLQLTFSNANYMQMSDLVRPQLEKKAWLPCFTPLPFLRCSDDATATASSLPPSLPGYSSCPFHSCQICGLLWQIQSRARPNAPTQAMVTALERLGWGSSPFPWGVVPDWAPAPRPRCSVLTLPCWAASPLGKALPGSYWRWDLAKDLGHLRLLAAAGLYISSQHHIARPQCSLVPASKLYWKAAKNTLNTFLMFLFHINNCCGRKWLAHFCLVGWFTLRKYLRTPIWDHTNRWTNQLPNLC